MTDSFLLGHLFFLFLGTMLVPLRRLCHYLGRYDEVFRYRMWVLAARGVEAYDGLPSFEQMFEDRATWPMTWLKERA